LYKPQLPDKPDIKHRKLTLLGQTINPSTRVQKGPTKFKWSVCRLSNQFWI